MERYIGYRMLFTTAQGTINGILKEWDTHNEQAKIDKDGVNEIVDILDIEDLEIINLNESKNNFFIKDESCIDHENQISKNKNTKFLDENDQKKINNEKNLSNNFSYDHNIKEKQIYNSVVEKVNNINIQNEKEISCFIKDDFNIVCKKNMTISNDENSSMLENISVNEVQYFKLLNDCFNIYGPTKEEFINVVSFNLQKLLKKYKLSNICISLGKNSLYNCIGYHLGRILKVKSYNIYIFENEDNNIDVLKYKYTYYNNENDNLLNNLSDFSLCISFGSTKIKSKEYLYINKIYDDFTNSTCISLGCITNYYEKQMYLIDVNISEELYKKYNLKRVFVDSTLVKIN